VIRRCHDNRERFMLSMHISVLANTVALTHPTTAADFAAIAESEAIAPVATFTVQPQLLQLGDDHAPAITAAQQRACSMSYEEAIEYTLAAVDQIITDLESMANWRVSLPGQESDDT
jgi:hypothetical protein